MKKYLLSVLAFTIIIIISCTVSNDDINQSMVSSQSEESFAMNLSSSITCLCNFLSAEDGNTIPDLRVSELVTDSLDTIFLHIRGIYPNENNLYLYGTAEFLEKGEVRSEGGSGGTTEYTFILNQVKYQYKRVTDCCTDSQVSIVTLEEYMTIGGEIRSVTPIEPTVELLQYYRFDCLDRFKL